MLTSEFPPGPGGIGTHAYHLARGLAQLGWSVRVVSPQDYVVPEEANAFDPGPGVSVIRVPSGRGAISEGLARFRAARGAISSSNVRAIVASGARMVWLGSAVARLHQVPWIAVGHGTEFGVTSGWERMLTSHSFNAASAVVSVSSYTAGLMCRCGIDRQKIRVIPNGADNTVFRRVPDADVDQFRTRSGLSGRRVILTVGNVTERKGQEVVIRAMHRVLESAPDALYVMVGLPTLRPGLEELARGLGIADAVRFAGRTSQQDLLHYMNCADVFAMTSRRTSTGDVEGFGIAVVEAALCGKPAVVSAGSGLVEAIVDGSTGIAVPENDAEATADAIVRLLSDGDLRSAMGHRAEERALAEQTWTRRVLEYDGVLRSLSADRVRPA